MVNRVILWTVPRSVSTAFERAFMQRPATRTFHEPYGGPYYFGPERSSPRYVSSPPDPAQSYARVTEDLLADPGAVDLVFVKDMAYYVAGRLDLGALAGFRHTFLIRHPRKSVRSLYRMAMRTDLDGWGSFDPEETGFRQLREVFDVAVEKLGQPPIIVDADDLLADPRKTLAAYCAAIEVPFDEGLLTWKAGPVTEFKTWSAWHTDAENSTGFVDKGGRAGRGGEVDSALPAEVEAAIAACLPDYESLYARRIGAR